MEARSCHYTRRYKDISSNLKKIHTATVWAGVKYEIVGNCRLMGSNHSLAGSFATRKPGGRAGETKELPPQG